ncbi:hypothetical protein LCGC14_1064540 [marine sediment metagenome]|uniref:Uncharacterized protein n=1 Tax=marine sediment metagenome TaxID=412755 RepID=A0A0F9Q323_9ZZZZ
MTTKTTKAKIPDGVKLEVTALIDHDMWAELQKQGWTDKDLEGAIKKSITFRNTVSGDLSHVPLFDIMSVELLKYY